jgi:hypothetical protein
VSTSVASSHLSGPRLQLVVLMQRIQYGTITNLTVVGGEPVFDPPPGVTRDIRFGEDPLPRSERDFVLKRQVLELLSQLDALGTGTVAVIEVKGGLPFRMRLTEAAVAA